MLPASAMNLMAQVGFFFLTVCLSEFLVSYFVQDGWKGWVNERHEWRLSASENPDSFGSSFILLTWVVGFLSRYSFGGKIMLILPPSSRFGSSSLFRKHILKHTQKKNTEHPQTQVCIHPHKRTQSRHPCACKEAFKGISTPRVLTSCITFLRQSRLAITDLQWPECRSCYRIPGTEKSNPTFRCEKLHSKVSFQIDGGCSPSGMFFFLRGKMCFINKLRYHNSHKVTDDMYAILYIIIVYIYTLRTWIYRTYHTFIIKDI